MATYLLDANVFIESKNRYYGFDFCPAFWDWIDQANEKQAVFSVARVYDELQNGADELAGWTNRRRQSLFLDPDEAMLPSLRAASRWVSSEDYQPAAVNEFLDSADYYLIAHAHGHAVVTHERAESTRKRVKIPNVCQALSVQCMTPFEMLRTEKARFILGEPAKPQLSTPDLDA